MGGEESILTRKRKTKTKKVQKTGTCVLRPILYDFQNQFTQRTTSMSTRQCDPRVQTMRLSIRKRHFQIERFAVAGAHATETILCLNHFAIQQTRRIQLTLTEFRRK
jgi:hypothetical protein